MNSSDGDSEKNERTEKKKSRIVSSGKRDPETTLEYWSEEELNDAKPVQKSIDANKGTDESPRDPIDN